MDRVMVFIDGSNLYHGLKENGYSTGIDFQRFPQILCGSGRRLIRTYYYNAPLDKQEDPEKHRRQQQFFDKLRGIEYFEVKLGRLQRRGQGWVEKGVDISIATDMIWKAHDNAYDTAILVSGDGDFAAAVECVKHLGKNVEVAYVTLRAYHLRQAADRFILIDQALLANCGLPAPD